MDQLPATSGNPLPAPRPSALQIAKDGGLKMLGKVRTEAGEAIHAAGVSIEKIHQRLILTIAGLLLMLVVGALFRSWDLLWVNYVLIAGFGLAALYAFLQPAHVVGVLLVSGGVAAVKGLDTAGSALVGYGKILGRIFLAFLIPLLLFALAPGDRSLGSSLPLIVLAPVMVLAMWLFGRVAPKVEKFVFMALPLLALTIALANMLIPERVLAGLGIPAWLRTGRPQDEELARLETLMEKQRNERQAAQLREIRAKLERGEPLTPEDEAVVLQAQKDRVTLTGWFGNRYEDLRKQVNGLMPAPAKAAPPPPPQGGSVFIPAKGWSAVVSVPAGYRLCMAATPRTQCHPAGKAPGIWQEGAEGCDALRFRARRSKATIAYRYVPAGAACS
ncbi:MAG: hypothetical protein ACAH11_09895 [Sphingomonas sp.]